MKNKPIFVHEQYFNAGKYLFHDESLTREWLVQFKNFGEFAAAEYVVEEVEIRTEDENYFPCLRQSL